MGPPWPRSSLGFTATSRMYERSLPPPPSLSSVPLESVDFWRTACVATILAEVQDVAGGRE